MEGSTKYATFFLIFTVVFTYYSYALAFSVVPEARWDVTLDLDEIFTTGIMLGEADDLNISWASGWHYFDINNTEMRVEWDWIATIGDHFRFQTHAKFFGVELYWAEMSIRDYGGEIFNSSVIIEWNNQTKVSRFKANNGYYILFSDPEQEHNITRAIYDDGNVTITVAESISFADDVNLRTFIAWYAGMVTGTSRYGLPSVFNIVLQLISVLALLSVVILAKEMIRL